MIRSRSWLPLLSSLLAVTMISASPKRTIPKVSLEVTVRQKVDGKLGNGLYIARLRCWQGDCSLTWLSLNTCMRAAGGKDAFYPKVESSSTREGNLQVVLVDDAIEVKEIDPVATTTLRFAYKKNPGSFMSAKVTSFSGGFVKSSDILGKVITVEYVPLMGAFSEIKLDCAALLPGVDTSK